jgi:hypothetical protein
VLRRSTIFLITMCLNSAPSFAADRPDIRLMSCADVKALVQREKSVTLDFTDYTYDRVASDRSECGPSSYGERTYRATKDQRRCDIGYVCVPTGQGTGLFGF